MKRQIQSSLMFSVNILSSVLSKASLPGDRNLGSVVWNGAQIESRNIDKFGEK